MLWPRARGGVASTLWLPIELRRRFESEAKEYAPRETGGMLVGYTIGSDAVVTQTIGAGSRAVHRRGGFEPDGFAQQRELDRVYATSGRIETYLGDWHSHPDGLARPSGRDRKTAARIARERSARCPTPITLIVANRWCGECELAAFIYVGRRRCFRRLTLVTHGG
jgi:integrative and conjugative element protein (TIGR02256 family)